MITDKGKAIIAKYLASQTGSYGNFIAIGCGHDPGTIGQKTYNVANAYVSKEAGKETELEFETVRVPVSAVTVVTENDGTESSPVDVTKIVFSGELPTQARYGITEVGLYPANTNIVAQSDSRMLLDFSRGENWEIHTATTSTSIDDYTSDNTPLDEITSKAFFFMAEDNDLVNDSRAATKEQPRMLSDVVLVSGNMSTETSGTLSGDHIHYVGKTVSLDLNSSSDVLKVAFSLIKKNASVDDPDNIYLSIQFASSETEAEGVETAAMNINIANFDSAASQSYFVVEQALGELVKTGAFSWSNLGVIKVFAYVKPPTGGSASDYLIGLDGLRFDNRYDQNLNPTYGLVAYSGVSQTYTPSIGSPFDVAIVKGENENSYIQIKIPVGVA